ncbi:Pentatricopeptide repeat (PPR) superfamily protein [Trifolium repens]|nr:Pentatricopeptide repeat (PPR) superfamily protein [Trifolium repens]
MSTTRSDNKSVCFDTSLVEDLTKMVDDYNRLAQTFRRVRDFATQQPSTNFQLKLMRHRSKDARMYNLPTSDEVAALIIGDDDSIEQGRDVIVRKFSTGFTKLPETHPSFLPMQYPMMFPRGQDGWHVNIEYREPENGKQRKRTRVTMREFIAFRIQERAVEYGNIVNVVTGEEGFSILIDFPSSLFPMRNNTELLLLPLIAAAVTLSDITSLGGAMTTDKLTRTIQGPILHSFNIATISELLSKQHWSMLKSHLRVTKPAIFLDQLLNAGVDSELVFRFFNWSQKEFRFSYGLEENAKVLHFLANSKRYSKVRSFLDSFVKYEKHTVSSVFHSLLLGGGRSGATALIIDMLLLAYVKNLELHCAYEAFRRAQDYGFKLSLTSCNPLLSALVKENKIGDVEYVYKEMIKRRIQPNLYTFNILINGLCRAGKLNKAEDVIEDMKAWGISPNVVTYNTLVDGYCKRGSAGKMYKAEAIMKEMLANKICPNEVTFNSLIDGFCKDENVLAAKKAFEEMQTQGLKPNVVTYNSLINGLCNNGKLEEAVDLWDKMVDFGLKPNIVTYNALINGFCKKKMMKEATKVFDDITKQELVPNAITFNTMIDAYCKEGMMDEGFALCSSMLDEGIWPIVSTYNCLIAGLCRKRDLGAAKELLNEMENKGLKGNVVTYNILIDGLCKDGKSRNAEKLLNEMFNLGLKPNHITYNTLMDGYCMEGKLKAALNVRARMEKERKQPNVVTYNVLIKGYCKIGKLEAANSLLNEMLEKGLNPNRTTYDIVRLEMLEKGFIPDIEGHLYNISSMS